MPQVILIFSLAAIFKTTLDEDFSLHKIAKVGIKDAMLQTNSLWQLPFGIVILGTRKFNWYNYSLVRPLFENCLASLRLIPSLIPALCSKQMQLFVNFLS